MSQITTTSEWGTWSRALGIAGVVGVGAAVGYYFYSKKSTTDDFFDPVEELETDPEVLKMQGNLLFKDFCYNQALLKFKRAIAFNTKEDKLKAVCYQNSAAVHEFNNDYESCLDACSRALVIDPFYVKAIQRRARCFLKFGELDNSVEDFLTVAFLTDNAIPKEVSEIMTLKVSDGYKARLGQDGFGRIPISPFVLKFWALHSLSRDPVIQLMKTSSKEGDAALFAECYNRIILEDPNTILNTIIHETAKNDSPYLLEACLLVARMYLYHSDHENCRSYLKACENLWAKAGEKQQELKDHRVSMYLLELVMSTDPAIQRELTALAQEVDSDNPDIYLVAGLAALDFNDISRARDMFALAVDKAPTSMCARAHNIFCQAFFAMESRDMGGVNRGVLAMEDFVKEVETSYPFVYLLAGRLYLLCDNTTESEIYFEKAKELMPTCGMVHFLSALASIKFDKTAWTTDALNGAAELFGSITNIDPYYAAPLSVLSKIYSHLQQYDEAIKVTDQALEIAANLVDYRLVFLERTLLVHAVKIAHRLKLSERDVVEKLCSRLTR